MSRGICLALTALLILALSGCASLLERSYSVVEPYAVRYWDSGAEDTLRAENYRDLVNSLLLLVEQRAEEGVILCYEEAAVYMQARAACQEVQNETMLGSYLLRDIEFTYKAGVEFSTMTLHLAYRPDAEDPEAVTTISDSQSLVDLLRVAVREKYQRLTARFVYDTPREEVSAAMEALWRELCQGEPDQGPEEEGPQDPEQPPELSEAEPDGPGPEGDEPGPKGDEPEDLPEDGGAPEEAVYPPCPWTARFYPNQDAAGIVEILLNPSGTAWALERVGPPQAAGAAPEAPGNA